MRHCHHFFSQRAVVMEQHHLRQITDGHIRVACNASFRRLVFAGNKPKQGGFACSVLSHQCDTLLAIDEEGDVVQHRAGRELHTNMINCYHSCRIVSC